MEILGVLTHGFRTLNTLTVCAWSFGYRIPGAVDASTAIRYGRNRRWIQQKYGSSVSRCKPSILRIARVPLESRPAQPNRQRGKTQTGRKPAIGPVACLVFGLGRAFRRATRHGLASFFACLPESRHAGRTG